MRKPAFIWDLDGTLLDSYTVIVSSLYLTYREFNIELDQEAIFREVITYSVGDFIMKMEKETGLPFDTIKKRQSEINNRDKLKVTPIKNAAEILAYLQSQSIPNFVFTHKGTTTESVLRNTGLYGFFEDIITGKDGFPRKPDPSAVNFLIEKHKLDRSGCYYVGDRTLDIECAENAGIGSILYLPEGSPTQPTGKETHIIQDLLEIREIVSRME